MSEITQNYTDPPPFQWSERKRQAAVLLAADEKSDEQIATECGVVRKTLALWKLHPEFRAEVQRLVGEYAARIFSRGIARREKRVDQLQERWEKLRQVIEERGEAHAEEGAPGGATGLLVRQEKMIGAGPLAREVVEYAVDTGLLKELREHEKQAAIEVGQWEERAILGGDEKKPLTVIILRDVSMDAI